MEINNMKYIVTSPFDLSNTLDNVLNQMYVDIYNFKFSINDKIYKTQIRNGSLMPCTFYEIKTWDEFFSETFFTVRHIFHDTRTYLAHQPIWWGVHCTESFNTRKRMEHKTHFKIGKHLHSELKKWAEDPAMVIMNIRPDVSFVFPRIQEKISYQMHIAMNTLEDINADQCWLLGGRIKI